MNKAARKLRDENNELELGLSREASDVMTDILVFIRSANISDLNQEIVRWDIGQMLLEGERRGRSILTLAVLMAVYFVIDKRC